MGTPEEQSENVRQIEMTCPHCRKAFTAPLLEGMSLRHAGFKCPHCKLFVAYDRSSS
jgi:transposase-like protein